VIDAELAEFLESGITILVGTRDAELRPETMRGVGAHVQAGGAELTVYLPETTATASVANLRDNGRIAVAFGRPADHRTIQVKGQVVEIAPADDEDRERIERYHSALAESWGFVGVPPRVTARLAWWPCHRVRLRVEEIFVQTPGPGAGAPLVPPPAGPPS
jgi:hypothetical protein